MPGTGETASIIALRKGLPAFGSDSVHNPGLHKSFDLELVTRQGRPSSQIAQVPSPPQKGVRRSTNGFSSEKFTKVLNGHV